MSELFSVRVFAICSRRANGSSSFLLILLAIRSVLLL